MVEIMKLTLADALHVVSNMREIDRQALRAAIGPVSDDVIAANRWQTEGPAWVLVDDDEPVAIFGVTVHTRWSGVAWLIATPRMSGEAWRKLMRHSRTVAANLTAGRLSGMHRIEMHVVAHWGAAARFAKRLGAVLEGTRRRAGRDGEDIQMWAIVKESK